MTIKAKEVNYTDAEIAAIEAAIAANGGSLNYEMAKTLANELGRKDASLRAKLVNMGKYERKGKTTKSGDKVERKEDIAKEIEALAEREFQGLADLPKATLKALREIVGEKAAA